MAKRLSAFREESCATKLLSFFALTSHIRLITCYFNPVPRCSFWMAARYMCGCDTRRQQFQILCFLLLYHLLPSFPTYYFPLTSFLLPFLGHNFLHLLHPLFIHLSPLHLASQSVSLQLRDLHHFVLRVFSLPWRQPFKWTSVLWMEEI